MDPKKGSEAWNSSIIDFYNNVFLDRMKFYLVNLDPKKQRLITARPFIPHLNPTTSIE